MTPGFPAASRSSDDSMARNLVVTVGTSLLTGPGRPFTFRFGSELPDREIILEWLRDADPVLASAELHTLHRLIEAEKPGTGDHVTLLASQTDEGWLAASALRSHLERVGRTMGIRTVEVREIEGLSYTEVEFMQSGLRSLARHLVRIVRQDRREATRPRKTVFLATGGFKPESAYATLVGTLTGVDVFYLHERFSRLVRIPPLPVRWDTGIVTRNRDFIDWLEEEPRPQHEVKERLKAVRELAPLVEYEEGHGYLTAVGLMIVDGLEEMPAPPEARPPRTRDPREPRTKLKLSKVPHHRPAGLESFAASLCREDWVSLVRASPGTRAARLVRLRDPDEGSFLLAYRWGDEPLEIEVQTTARDKAELDWVENELVLRLSGVSA